MALWSNIRFRAMKNMHFTHLSTPYKYMYKYIYIQNTTKYSTGYIIGVHASYVVEPLYADPFGTVLNCPELIIKLSFFRGLNFPKLFGT